MARYTKDTAVLASGLTLRWVLNHGFDYILYPIVLLWLGNGIGGVVMTVFAIIFNALIIRAYDWSKVDWLLIEKIKHLGQQSDAEGWMVRLLLLVRRNRVLTFLVLCLDDPVTVTLYFREGSYQFNGLGRRDWKIFLAANVVSNLYWIIGWVAVLEFIKKFF